MKIQFKVTYVDTASKVLVLGPVGCGLTGQVMYKNLPIRALDRFYVNQTVEADVPLPDFYPDNHTSYNDDLRAGCVAPGNPGSHKHAENISRIAGLVARAWGGSQSATQTVLEKLARELQTVATFLELQ